jgi:hypothetical protein
MWLVAEYQPVTLFSLKHALATSSGGKSLLVPTPFAVKMALLDAACRLWGTPRARDAWSRIRDLPVAVYPPRRAVVTNLFARILKPRRRPPAPGTPDAGPMGRTIAFREYVWAEGTLGFALGVHDEVQVSTLTELVAQINYLGKRGGFIQLLRLPEVAEHLPSGYVLLNPPEDQASFDSRGVLQMLDDCGPKMTFEHADIYSSKRIRLGSERLLHHVILPYRMVQSSRSYTLYERIDD